MAFGPFALQWRTPSPNPPNGSPLPPGITRSYISTPSGPLELLSAVPEEPISSRRPLFFAHGGFGCAEVWLSYMLFFASKGIPCYAVSWRGHGNSWYPGFWSMYFTGRHALALDLVAGIKHVEEMEKQRRAGEEDVRVILVAHSGGGALSQYVLSRGMVEVYGYCMLAAVPGFGSFGCYKFWAFTVPIHFPYRLFHPRYILANTSQIHGAFFSPQTPTSVVQHLERLLSPYETMLAPIQMLFRFVTGPDVISSIVGWRPRKTSSAKGVASGITQRLLVIAAEQDVLCTPAILLDAARRYRASFQQLAKTEKLHGVTDVDLRTEGEQDNDWDGVGFKVVPGVGHHLQNNVEWERGAEEILAWVEGL